MKNSSIQHQIVRFDEICRNVSKRVNDPRKAIQELWEILGLHPTKGGQRLGKWEEQALRRRVGGEGTEPRGQTKGELTCEGMTKQAGPGFSSGGDVNAMIDGFVRWAQPAALHRWCRACNCIDHTQTVWNSRPYNMSRYQPGWP